MVLPFIKTLNCEFGAVYGKTFSPPRNQGPKKGINSSDPSKISFFMILTEYSNSYSSMS